VSRRVDLSHIIISASLLPMVRTSGTPIFGWEICAGHIGFEIAEPFRGRGLSLWACRAIAPFVRSVYESVTITCDPDNLASRGIIERLGAVFVDEVAVPAHDPHYQRGRAPKGDTDGHLEWG